MTATCSRSHVDTAADDTHGPLQRRLHHQPFPSRPSSTGRTGPCTSTRANLWTPSAGPPAARLLVRTYTRGSQPSPKAARVRAAGRRWTRRRSARGDAPRPPAGPRPLPHAPAPRRPPRSRSSSAPELLHLDATDVNVVCTRTARAARHRHPHPAERPSPSRWPSKAEPMCHMCDLGTSDSWPSQRQRPRRPSHAPCARSTCSPSEDMRRHPASGTRACPRSTDGPCRQLLLVRASPCCA